MQQYQTKAYAKINLCLDVIGKLENGYHEVRMIMQTVGIYDELTFRKTTEEITITSDCGELPLNQDNLIYKAILLMKETYGIVENVAVHLQKNIPIAAGMAGGSTDAAATLKAMNVLFDLQLSEKEQMKLGVRLGADVPYCVMGGTALAEGIGERLTPLKPAPECVLLVAKPQINVSTKYVYEHLDAYGVKEHPDVEQMIMEINNENLSGVVAQLGNVLEKVTVQAHPVVETIKAEMMRAGAIGSLMSGSGPTVFGIFLTKQEAQKGLLRLQEAALAKQIFITEFVRG